MHHALLCQVRYALQEHGSGLRNHGPARLWESLRRASTIFLRPCAAHGASGCMQMDLFIQVAAMVEKSLGKKSIMAEHAHLAVALPGQLQREDPRRPLQGVHHRRLGAAAAWGRRQRKAAWAIREQSAGRAQQNCPLSVQARGPKLLAFSSGRHLPARAPASPVF